MIYSYLKRHKLAISLATISTLLLGLVSSVTFALVGPAIEIISSPTRQAPISLEELLGPRIAGILHYFGIQGLVSIEIFWRWLPVLLIGTALLRCSLALFQWYLWEQTSEKVAMELRTDIVDRYLYMHPEDRRENSASIDKEIAASVGNDIRLLREYLVHFLGGFPREIIQIVFSIATLFLIDPSLATFFLLGLAPAGVLVSSLGKKIRRRSQKALDNSSKTVEWLQQRLSGIETIKQFQTEEYEYLRMESFSQRLFQLFAKAARVKARTSPLMETAAVAAMMVVLSYSLGKIADGQLNSSMLMSFFSVLGILSQSSAKLGKYYNSNKEGEAATLRLEAVFNLMKSHQMKQRHLSFNPSNTIALKISNLAYSFTTSDHFAVKDLNWNLDRGKIYVLAGPSGSGKSTVVKLILGIWRLQMGEILWGLDSFDQIGYLPQAIHLLPESVETNIVYPDRETDKTRLEDALKRVGLWSFFESMPEGTKILIGEGGLTLSGGQAQRIQLARIIYHRFRFVIVDEGTSALDPETESLIFATFQEMARSGSSFLIVAHRVSILQIAHEVVVLNRGRLHFKGKPKDLVSGSGWQDFFENAANPKK